MPDTLEIPGAEYVGPASGGAPEIPGAEYVGPAQPQNVSPSQYFAAHPGMDPLAVQSAFQQLQKPTGPAIPTTPEMVMRGQMGVENAGRGTGGSAIAGAMQNVGGLAGRFQKVVAAGEDIAGFHNAAENTRLAAERSEDFAPSPDHYLAGKAGQLAGGLPFAFTGPTGALLSAANTGEQTYHNIEERRDQGEQISGLRATGDVALQSALSYLMNRVGQKNMTGPLAPQLVKAVLPEIESQFGKAAARIIAAGVLESGVQGGQQILSNLATKATIDPSQGVLEGLGESAGLGFGLGTLGRTLHEGVEHQQYNTTRAPQQRSQAPPPAQVPQFRGETYETGEQQNAPQQPPQATIQPPQQHVDSTYRVQGEGPYQVGGTEPDKGTAHPNFNRLPSPPDNLREMSNNQLRDWMSSNGYEAPAKGTGMWSKTRLMTEIERQRTEPAAGQRFTPALPQGAEGMDAGALRRFASEQGIEIPAAIAQEAAKGNPRKVLFNFLKESTGQSTGESLRSRVPAVPESAPLKGEEVLPHAANAGEAAPVMQPNPGTKQIVEQGQNGNAQAEPRNVEQGVHSQENRPAALAPEETFRDYLPMAEHEKLVKDAGGQIVDADKLHESHREVLEVGKALTGRDFIPYRGKGRGFYTKDGVYYNPEKNPTMASRREAIAHEATHWLQDNKPELVKPIADAIPKSYGDKLIAQYEADYEHQQGKKLPDAQRQRELEAFTVGKAMSRPAIMRAVMNQNPGAFTKFADAVLTKLRSLTAKGRLTNQIIDSLRAAREEVGGKAPETATGESSFLPSSSLTGEGSIYKEEIKPKLEKLTDAASWGFKTLRELFPMETAAGNKNAANVFRGRFGEAMNNVHRAETAFEEARKGFDRAGKDDNQEFMRRMYNGEKQATPELQKIADDMYADTNAGRQKLIGLGNEAAKGWSDKWFNMMWKKDQAKADLMLQANRPGKIEGQAGFLKKRQLSDFEEGLKQGLVPKYDNPVEMFLATKMEREKFMAGFAGMDDLAKDGSIKRFADEKQVPAGWEEVPSGARGVLKNIIKGDGSAYAPKDVNRILNNIVTPSKIGSNPIFRLAMDANNTMTQTLLGLSAFHLRKVTQELVNLNMARALDLKMQGQEGAGKALLKSAVSPKDAVLHGGEVQKMMLGLKNASPQQARVIDSMIQGGMRAKGDSVYETQFGRKFGKALRQGGVQGYIRAAIHAPLAGNEALMQKGVFNYVQRAKLHMGYELTSDYLSKNPNAKLSEIRSEVGKISDHLDNVLGLMVRDNLFWNRTARDLATLSTLSVGWNYGSGRALGGGLVDLGKGLGGLATGKGLSGLETRRISYLATTAALTGITGAAITYMATGKAPQNLRDYVFPPTGAKDRNGHDVRLNTGFYSSDYFDFFHDPAGTLKAKGSPLLHAASDLISNRTYQGTKIFDKDDSWYKIAGDVAKYLGKSIAPLSASQLYEQISSGGTEGKSRALQTASLLGIKTAAKKLSMSDAELEAQQLIGEKQPIGGKTEAEGEKSQLLNKLADGLRDKQSDAMAEIRKAVHEGKLQPRDVSTIQKRSKEPVGLKGMLGNTELHPDDLMKVWGKMTPDERRSNQWLIRGRIGRSGIAAEQKREFFQRISKDVKDAVGK